MRRKKGIPGNHGLERGIGHIQAPTVLNPIPLIGLTETDGGPGHDQKMKGEEGDPGLLPAPAVETIQQGRSINEGARREVMTKRGTTKDDEFQKTKDVVGLGQSPSPIHVPGPEPDLDQRTVSTVGQNPGPDPGRGGENPANICLSLQETRWSHDLKRRGETGLDPVQERKGKKKDHPKAHTKLLFHPPKTQRGFKTRKKRKMFLKATVKMTKLKPI